MEARRAAAVALAVATLLGTSGCASGIAGWIVGERNHQGDVAVAHRNYADASRAYQLALKIAPQNAHARGGLTAVQVRLAQALFANSKFDDAIDALAIAAKYTPGDDRVRALREAIEQAEIKRDIVVSNYPAYKVTATALTRSYSGLKTQSEGIAKSLRRFGYTYDTDELSSAIRQSYALGEDVTRMTNRLVQYRQLVESGIPERGGEALAPPASLLPLP